MPTDDIQEPAEKAAALARASERQDLEREVATHRAAARRHTFWAALGVSPAAALPLFVSFDTIGFVGVGIAVALISGLEAWRAVRSNRAAFQAEARLKRLLPTKD